MPYMLDDLAPWCAAVGVFVLGLYVTVRGNRTKRVGDVCEGVPVQNDPR